MRAAAIIAFLVASCASAPPSNGIVTQKRIDSAGEHELFLVEQGTSRRGWVVVSDLTYRVCQLQKPCQP